MDKLVKKEVLTVYISQFAMIIVALFCCLVPLFSDSLYLTGWKAISGLCILASVFVANIFYMTTQFQGKKSLLPGKIALECMGEMFFRIDENCNKVENPSRFKSAEIGQEFVVSNFDEQNMKSWLIDLGVKLNG